MTGGGPPDGIGAAGALAAPAPAPFHGPVQRIGCATSTAVAGLLNGPCRPARPAAATRYALHLATGDPDLPALAVVTRDAIRLPNALVLPCSAAERPLNALRDVASPAGFGAGGVTLGPYRFQTEVSWTPPRVQGVSPPPRPALLRRLLTLLGAEAQPPPPALVPGLAELRRALRAGGAVRIRRAARALLGLGPGLTPSGDDVLCGALLASRAWGGPLAPLTDALADAPCRTPLLSAALLCHAARGECVGQAAALVRALNGDAPLEPALRELLAVGHHSGGDLARGVAAVAVTRTR
ncbi:DUF2877 domain-containing protein [Streptomyces sp. NPDC002520]